MCVDGAGGGWGDDAERVWAGLAHAIAAASSDEVSSVTADLYQSLSLILQQEGARAVLRRLPGTAAPLASSLAAARDALASRQGMPISFPSLLSRHRPLFGLADFGCAVGFSPAAPP